MVAEFRLVKPNMSYVNVSNCAGSSGDNNNGLVLPVPDEDMNDLTSARTSIRGNILRGNDSNLLPDLLSSMPELRPVVMGGPTTSHEELQAAYDQQQHYDWHGSLSRSQSQPQLQRVGGAYPPQQPQAGERYNNNTYDLGSTSSGLSNPANRSTLSYGTNHMNNESLSGPSSSSFSNSSHNQPRLRVANLPLAPTSFGGPHCSSFNNPDLPRSYSATDGQSYLPSGHLGSGHPSTAFGFNSEPLVTVIRTTSTVEYARGSSPSTHPFNNFSSNESHANSGPIQSAGMSFQHQSSQQSVFMNGNSPQPHLSGQEVGGAQRRAHRQAMHRATVNAASGLRIGDHNTVKVVKDLLKNQETLVKENEELKRKLQLLVSTFNDEQKLHKVLKCLEEKKRAAHSQSYSTS